MRGFFDAGNGFWRTFTQFTDTLGLSLCWLLCSLPIVTLGASTTALYDAVFHGIRKEEPGDYVRFFRTFRRELKTSLLVTLPLLVLFLVYFLFSRVAFAVAIQGNQLAGVLVYAYQLLFCVPLGIWLFACATLSRFTFGPGALIKTACKLALTHLPSAIAVTALTVTAAKVVRGWPVSLILLPALTALLASFFLERIFAPFLPEEKEILEDELDD